MTMDKLKQWLVGEMNNNMIGIFTEVAYKLVLSKIEELEKQNNSVADTVEGKDRLELSSVDFNSPEMKDKIKLVEKEIKQVFENAKIDTSKLHIIFK